MTCCETRHKIKVELKNGKLDIGINSGDGWVEWQEFRNEMDDYCEECLYGIFKKIFSLVNEINKELN